MQWIAISGSWRKVSAEVERDVREEVTKILLAGDGIITGGALGVDFIATREALAMDAAARQIRIILPTSFTIFADHFSKRAGEGVITFDQAEMLIRQLNEVKSRNNAAIVELEYTVCNPETYHARNSAVIRAADRLIAFQVNDSQGTQDAVDKAVLKGIPIQHKKYSL